VSKIIVAGIVLILVSAQDNTQNGDQKLPLKSALHWLARHQNRNGSWSITGCVKQCGKYNRSGNCKATGNQFEGEDEYNTGATGLALLAFLGAGYKPDSKYTKDGINYGKVLKKGITYLLKIQDASGRIGGQTEHMMYNHIIATLAIAEAHLKNYSKKIPKLNVKTIKRIKSLVEKLGHYDPETREKAHNELLKLDDRAIEHLKPFINNKDAERASRIAVITNHLRTKITSKLMKAVDYITKAQNVEVGQLGETFKIRLAWRYEPKSGDNDSSVTGWAVLALKSAEDLGIKITKDVFRGVDRWYKMAVDQETGIVGYNRKWGPRYPLGAFIRGVNGRDRFNILPTCTAIMVTALKRMGRKDRIIQKSLGKIMKYSPDWDKATKKVDFYYWLFGTLAVCLSAKEGSEKRKDWFNALKNIIKNQNNKLRTCKEGSWEPETRWSCKAGRVGITAMGALILEIYYGNPRVLGVDVK